MAISLACGQNSRVHMAIMEVAVNGPIPLSIALELPPVIPEAGIVTSLKHDTRPRHLLNYR